MTGDLASKEDVDFAISKISDAVNKLRQMSPLWEMHNEGIDLNTVEWSHH